MSRHDDEHGRDAGRPTEIPSAGWRDVLTRTRKEIKDDRATLLAAGVAFYGLLALVPGMAALVSIYGLFATPDRIVDQVGRWLGAAPEEARNLITAQLQSVTSSSGGAVSLTLI